MSEDVWKGLNRVKDDANKTDLEKKHIPTIHVPSVIKAREPFEAKIVVGEELAHPDEGAHHIQWVELFAGDAFLSRVDFTPTVSTSPFTLTLKLNEDTVLRAHARCNLHGVWETTYNLKVVK